MRGHTNHNRMRGVYSSSLLAIVVLSILVQLLPGVPALASSLQPNQHTDLKDVELGRLDQSNSSLAQLESSIPTQQDGQMIPASRLSIVSSRREHRNRSQAGGHQEHVKKPSISRKHDEVLSTDCWTKRNEVLERQSQTTATATHATFIPLSTGYQRLKPKVEVSSATTPVVLNETLANNFDGEHIPRCRHDGSFEPVQCHKIGYCWCVNKYGQAIKNSAVMSGEEPFCDPSMYESGSDDQLVVAGISAQRMKNILKVNGGVVDSTTPNGHINFEAAESATPEPLDSESLLRMESAKRAGSQDPTMPLIPNDCKKSRLTASERAMRFVNDSIWVPECDMSNEKLYAERQCHRSRVCWCVDQSTGLPLRTGEQLSLRSTSSNCTEIKKILELASLVAKPKALPAKPQQPPFYQGSSEFCDSDKRIEFVVALSNQFRQQISEYLRQNPTITMVPNDLSSANPYAISEAQVSKWKFNIMDKDLDGKLGDREWSKFKNNFKLVDKPDELDNPFKQQKSPYFTLAPLLIVRSQRKCWRDFLEFCGNGDLLVDESISLTKWLSCTEVPPKSPQAEQNYSSRSRGASIENTYAHSREAAIVRSKKKNPFLGILKPD